MCSAHVGLEIPQNQLCPRPPLLERRSSENNKYGFRRPFPRFEKPSRGDWGAIKQDMESFLKGE